MKTVSLHNTHGKTSTNMSNGSTNNQQLELPSDIEGIHIIEKLIDTICSTYKLSEDHYGNILVAVTEAVNNAIYHGNKANPTKKVHVGFETSPTCISFSVRDEGDGFDFSNLPDPTDPANIEKPSGRGIFLMKNLADEVSFSDDGCCVFLSFQGIMGATKEIEIPEFTDAQILTNKILELLKGQPFYYCKNILGYAQKELEEVERKTIFQGVPPPPEIPGEKENIR